MNMRLVRLKNLLSEPRNRLAGAMSVKDKRDVLFLSQYFYPEYKSSTTLPCDTVKITDKGWF